MSARVALGALVLALLAVAPAEAHRLQAEASVSPEGEVVLELFFSDGVTPEGAEVVVTQDGAEVARGLTESARVIIGASARPMPKV